MESFDPLHHNSRRFVGESADFTADDGQRSPESLSGLMVHLGLSNNRLDDPETTLALRQWWQTNSRLEPTNPTVLSGLVRFGVITEEEAAATGQVI